MFENLVSFRKGRYFLDEAYGEYREMPEGGWTMFTMVCGRLLDAGDGSGLRRKVLDGDSAVNGRGEWIRTRIVEHTALQPTVDVAARPAPMSVPSTYTDYFTGPRAQG